MIYDSIEVKMKKGPGYYVLLLLKKIGSKRIACFIIKKIGFLTICKILIGGKKSVDRIKVSDILTVHYYL
jgi:hypothetical protein